MAANTKKPRDKSSTDRWENEGGPARADAASLADEQQVDLHELGIIAVQLTVFDCAGYRYSNLRDAIAASKRAANTGAS